MNRLLLEQNYLLILTLFHIENQIYIISNVICTGRSCDNSNMTNGICTRYCTMVFAHLFCGEINLHEIIFSSYFFFVLVSNCLSVYVSVYCLSVHSRRRLFNTSHLNHMSPEKLKPIHWYFFRANRHFSRKVTTS